MLPVSQPPRPMSCVELELRSLRIGSLPKGIGLHSLPPILTVRLGPGPQTFPRPRKRSVLSKSPPTTLRLELLETFQHDLVLGMLKPVAIPQTEEMRLSHVQRCESTLHQQGHARTLVQIMPAARTGQRL